MTNGFRFVVIADSHIRPPTQEIDAYPSNALTIQRNKFIVDLCNRIDARFVVHLGDIVHPLPVEETHEEAIDLARGVYEDLRHPIHFVAGNHDVGDKPNAHVAVPAVAEENYPVFEAAWGPSYHSFDVDGCHFAAIDTQILNSGLDRERSQQTWLESDLEEAEAAGKRVFIFTHYPPFIRDRHENEHYDNIGEPARSWFLDLLTRRGVEAVFSGHVHNFLYNRYASTDLYVAPSTAFVRPDYSELASIPPTSENGRDDPPKLGLLIVDVAPNGHSMTPLRSFGSTSSDDALPMPLETSLDPHWVSSVGVTLRHGWTSVTDFPAAGLDEFNRKQVRNDGPLLAMWEARAHDARIPLADLSTSATAERLEHLTSRGMRFSVVSAGAPNSTSIELVRSNAGSIHRWEIVAPPDRYSEVLGGVADRDLGGVSLAIAPITPIGSPGAAVHHFVSSGFRLDDDPLLGRWLDADPDRVFESLVFRVPWQTLRDDDLATARKIAKTSGRRAIVVVDLPRASESSTFDDDGVIDDLVGSVANASAHEPEVDVFFDGFTDHDRGYYPRHGLIDRAFNPRQAFYRLIAESASAT